MKVNWSVITGRVNLGAGAIIGYSGLSGVVPVKTALVIVFVATVVQALTSKVTDSHKAPDASPPGGSRDIGGKPE